MVLGNFITQIFIGTFLIAIFKHSLKINDTKLKKILFFGGFVLLMGFDLYQYCFPKNYYSYYGITKRFTPEDLKRQRNALSLMHHPDKNGSDGMEFGKVQELFEIFSNPKNKNIIEIYDLHNTDLIALYFDRLSNTKMESYQLEKGFDIWVENYLILFLMIFMLKEINVNNRKRQFLCMFLIGGMVLIELAVHRLYEDIFTAKNIHDFIDKWPFFNNFRTVEVIYLMKRTILALILISLTFYENFLKIKKDLNLKKAILEVKNLKEENFEKFQKLAIYFKKKIEKMQTRKRNYNRTQLLFLIVIGVYWMASFFDFF